MHRMEVFLRLNKIFGAVYMRCPHTRSPTTKIDLNKAIIYIIGHAEYIRIWMFPWLILKAAYT